MPIVENKLILVFTLISSIASAYRDWSLVKRLITYLLSRSSHRPSTNNFENCTPYVAARLRGSVRALHPNHVSNDSNYIIPFYTSRHVPLACIPLFRECRTVLSHHPCEKCLECTYYCFYADIIDCITISRLQTGKQIKLMRRLR